MEKTKEIRPLSRDKAAIYLFLFLNFSLLCFCYCLTNRHRFSFFSCFCCWLEMCNLCKSNWMKPKQRIKIDHCFVSLWIVTLFSVFCKLDCPNVLDAVAAIYYGQSSAYTEVCMHFLVEWQQFCKIVTIESNQMQRPKSIRFGVY